MTDPCGTPDGQGAVDDSILYRLTCWVLPVRKIWVHNQNDLVTFIDASFCGKIPWSIKYDQTRNTAWIIFLPDGVICVMLNHFCVVGTRAGNVDRPRVNARWLFFISKSKIISWSWSSSRTLVNCARQRPGETRFQYRLRIELMQWEIPEHVYRLLDIYIF